MRVLFKRHLGEGPGRPGRLLIARAVGKSFQEVTTACDSVGCYLGYALYVKGIISVYGHYRLLGQTKWMLRQQYEK